MKKHQKHTPLTRRNSDYFAQTEISILGAKCEIVTDLVTKIANFSSKSLKIGYLDASHNEAYASPLVDVFTRQYDGNTTIEQAVPNNAYQDHLRFSNYDLLLINGNHFKAAHQIVILDPDKEASIAKRLPQINSILCIIKLDDQLDYFPCLLEKFPKLRDIPTYSLTDIAEIHREISTLMATNIPKIKGLIMAGGKSKRMGTDKTQLQYHGKTQLAFLRELMNSKGIDPFISVSSTPSTSENKFILDSFTNLGPFGGICSAFQHNPNTAWLVIAADVPFVNSTLIEKLLDHRNPSKVATAIKGKSSQFMEPLITLYEPKAYPQLLSFLAMGYACPRKMLINNEVEIVEVDDVYVTNVNTPEEYEKAILKLK